MFERLTPVLQFFHVFFVINVVSRIAMNSASNTSFRLDSAPANVSVSNSLQKFVAEVPAFTAVVVSGPVSSLGHSVASAVSNDAS